MVDDFRKQSGWDQQGTIPVCFFSQQSMDKENDY